MKLANLLLDLVTLPGRATDVLAIALEAEELFASLTLISSMLIKFGELWLPATIHASNFATHVETLPM
ncbi:hypothetical protein HDU99_003664, partial [Rhizoclosmatium hyalinum]